MVREGQNIELYRDSRTTSASLADHQWSAEQTLGITGVANELIIASQSNKSGLLFESTDPQFDAMPCQNKENLFSWIDKNLLFSS